MKNISLIAYFLLIQSILMAQPFSEHRWQNRLVLILVDSPEDSLALKQLKEFQDAEEELLEYKLKIYLVAPEKCQMVLPSSKSEKSNPKTAYDRYATPNVPFEVILIGLDGGIKMRKNKVVPRQEIYALIDGMPIRRAEKRSKKIKE